MLNKSKTLLSAFIGGWLTHKQKSWNIYHGDKEIIKQEIAKYEIRKANYKRLEQELTESDKYLQAIQIVGI